MRPPNVQLVLLAIVAALSAGAVSQAPYGLAERIPNTSFLPGGTGRELGEMRLHQVFSGAYLGAEAVPQGWKEKLENRAYIEDLAERLWLLKRGG